MKIGVLTSSRADYGIYLPLLKEFKKDAFFKTEIIAFGTHLSQAHGYTLKQIEQDGFDVPVQVDTMPSGDNPQHISEAMGKTISAFSKVWQQHTYDLVFCLGDRYEMFAACAASVPFNVNLAHIHGGEQTLGAIDEAFRHSITHMARWHFTTTDVYKNRVIALKGNNQNVFNVGALSIDNLKELPLLSIQGFKEHWNIDLNIPTILITFHPETVSFEKNAHYTNELIAALEETTGYQLVITMPNADTMGNMIREKLNAFINSHEQAIGIETFGALGYLSCMKHCALMLGNTSSGFVEASYFPKYVINIGNRQEGRIVTPNMYNCPVSKSEILSAIGYYKTFTLPQHITTYGDGSTAQRIADIIRKAYE